MNYIPLFITLFICLSCGSSKKEASHPKFPVEVARVIQKDVPIYLETIGNVEPLVQVNVVSRVDGKITGVYFREGQEVEKGDLLFTIDPRLFQAKVTQAAGALQESRAAVDLAREKVARYSSLTEQEYYSQLDFDVLKSSLYEAEGTLKKNEAALEQAKLQLSYCWIYAPIQGRTSILQKDIGNVLKKDESQLLVTINQVKPIYISFFMPEKHLAAIRKYNSMGPLETLITTAEFSHSYVRGKLKIIDNSIDTATGTFTMRSIFTNDKEQLWPGKYVRVRLILYTAKDACVIPFQAVNISHRGKYVFVVDDNQQVAMRPIQLGMRFGEQIIIEKGVKAGEKVVTLGAANLAAGTKVMVKSGEHL